MDRLTSILLAAGLGCFLFAFALSGLYPWLITDFKKPEATIREVAAKVSPEFRQLKEQYPVAFSAFERSGEALTARELAALSPDDPARLRSEEAWIDAHADALRQGRDLYIAEACWHCHSQYVREVSNEEQRFGRVRSAADDNNALQRPVLWGTRRVGPDLTNAGGRKSNDWHVAHLWDPQSTSPGSVMPRYTWYFEDGFQVFRTPDPDVAEQAGLPADTRYPLPGVHPTEAEASKALEAYRAALPENLRSEGDRMTIEASFGPNNDALALIAYLQWLGTWTDADREAAQ